MKTALVYDWLVAMGGGEKTLCAMQEAYPSPLYTLVHDAKRMKGTSFEGREIHSSWLQKFPFATKLYRYYLPLFPLAIEHFDLGMYDLVISASHAVAKGVLVQPHQLHLCYCFTPMRYAWDLTHYHLSRITGIEKMAAKLFLHYLRHWDIAALNRVDHFAAISRYVARRIKKTYDKEATVIYPPVDTDAFPFSASKDDYYLSVSRLVPYKRIDMIVEAFSSCPDKKLLVVGEGPEMQKIKRLAKKNVEILGWQPQEKVQELMKNAKAFVFAAVEDFGIAAVEAQATGTPVIALGKGGALETVIPHRSGLFFAEATAAHLVGAITEFEKQQFDPYLIRTHALTFNRQRFIQEFKQFVHQKWEKFNEIRHSSGG